MIIIKLHWLVLALSFQFLEKDLSFYLFTIPALYLEEELVFQCKLFCAKTKRCFKIEKIISIEFN